MFGFGVKVRWRSGGGASAAHAHALTHARAQFFPDYNGVTTVRVGVVVIFRE